jgi:hypothetical protein
VHAVIGRRRHVVALALAAAALVAECADSGSHPSQPSASSGAARHRPFFPQCGGVSDQAVAELTRVSGLVNTAQNSVGCQWLVHGSIHGPYFSFSLKYTVHSMKSSENWSPISHRLSPNVTSLLVAMKPS